MRGALLRFRVMAYIVGVVLLILTFGMVLKYGFDNSHVVELVGPFHGILYVFYLITVIDLGLKAKFSVTKMILVMLAGTIPFVSFIAEHKVAKQLVPVVAAENAATKAAAQTADSQTPSAS